MTRERILITALSLYTRYGIKGVTMNQLANELQVSKKTLYLEFDSKDDLVAECIDYESERIARVLEKTIAESSESLETIVLICKAISGHLTTVCPAFFKDMGRYEYADKVIEQRKIEILNLTKILLQRGVKEGDVIENVNFELIMSILIEQLHTRSDNNASIIITMLRGICTEQGMKKLETYYKMTQRMTIQILN